MRISRAWPVLLLLAAPGLAGAATVELISGNGTASDFYGASSQPALSADGRYVAFASHARNLVPGQVDTNNSPDLFVWDRVTGSITLDSHSPGSAATATQGAGLPTGWPSFSADGRFLAFTSPAVDLVCRSARGGC